MPQELLSKQDMQNVIRRLASQVVEDHPSAPLLFVGIHTRGVVLSERVGEEARALRPDGPEIEFGTVDISLYRDDLDNLGAIPLIKGSDLPVSLDGRIIILFDDVLFTGRTIRAALEHLLSYGRPKRIQLAVLVDRGNRELPIAATFTGIEHLTTRDDHIAVRFAETDPEAEEGVFLL